MCADVAVVVVAVVVALALAAIECSSVYIFQLLSFTEEHKSPFHAVWCCFIFIYLFIVMLWGEGMEREQVIDSSCVRTIFGVDSIDGITEYQSNYSTQISRSRLVLVLINAKKINQPTIDLI